MIVYAILCLLLGLFYSILIIYYAIGWERLQPFYAPSGFVPHTMVTVLVAARNEEANIENLISCFLAQRYPETLIELIIVDDGSTDATASLVQSYKSERIRLLQLSPDTKNSAYKKRAINYGLSQSKGTLILTTDADCVFGENWVVTMVSFQEQNKSCFISAPVIMEASGGMFQQFQSLEFAGLVGIGAAALSHKHPNMCNGANVAYLKEAFLEVGGYEGNESIPSGDDEFLMHKMFAIFPERVQFLKSREAIVRTKPCMNLSSFVHQRIRWVSKSTKYENRNITRILVCCYIFNLSILVNIMGMFYDPLFVWLFLFQFLLKILVEGYLLQKLTKFLEISRLMRWLMPEQLLHICYVVIIGVLGNTVSYRWKGRKV